ncbi:MAG: L-glutamate gamma-semialdehyde dehydrogenase [Bryobacterales bacterium]|nr:L-glutamate gamma-semialdehyde dehydrogenase [Bryobacterales bacterium]
MTPAGPPPFRNESYTDFSQPVAREAMRAALAGVAGRLGQTYRPWIGGRFRETDGTFDSFNPSRPAQLIGRHGKGSAADAHGAVEAAYAAYPAWSRTPSEERVRLLLRCVEILKRRKLEFNAWLVLESGKSWMEAEADTSEAIDFCGYYARLMLRHASPEPLLQMPGERGHLRYLPLGVGIIIPPWNFPLAILAGMTAAALVAGNTVVIKPSSDTPTIAAMFVEVLAEAGFPGGAYQFLPGPGAAVGDTLVTHPRTRFISFTGSKAVGLRINQLAAQPAPGQIWIKRVIAEMGGKNAIIVDAGADLDAAASGILASAFGYQGQKCSACSRAIADERVYDALVERLAAGAGRLTVGPADDPSYDMGPVINAQAKRTILGYIEQGRKEARLIAGGAAVPGLDGHFIQPTIIADAGPGAIIFREEIFGPVLAVTRARDFDHALALANDTEYGLTGAVYASDPALLRRAEDEFFAGNLYLNRKCTGAMTGCHPFGGFNMSGTDSKAGGPDYLLQYMQAKSIAERLPV